MFVVAINMNFKDDCGYSDSRMVQLCSSTKAANRIIAEMLLKEKTKELLASKKREITNELYPVYGDSWRVEIEMQKLKPKYDQSFRGNKEYEAKHLEAINHWKTEICPPMMEKAAEMKKTYLEAIDKKYNEFVTSKQLDGFTQEELNSVNIGHTYSTEILEVLD